MLSLKNDNHSEIQRAHTHTNALFENEIRTNPINRFKLISSTAESRIF